MNGLVLALDAGNTKSYPGSGTTWTDLSGRGNTGTLTGGLTYSNTNGGSIVFDGSDSKYVSTNLVLPSPSTTPTTFDLVFKYNSTAAYKGLIGASEYQQYGFSIGFMGQNDIRMTYNAPANGYEPSWTYNSSIISNGTFVFDGRNITAYRNGSVISTYTASFDVTADSRGVWLGRNRQGGWGSAQCDIYCAKVYNKALSAAEIQQNFNALRGRFGI
jgi:hypothetical protein